MIKTINVTPLNTTFELFYKCDVCKNEETYVLENLINTNNDGYPTNQEEFTCSKCNSKLEWSK